MTSSVFIDSSVLIEYIKGTKTTLFNNLITQISVVSFINETVVSEFMFHFIAVNGNTSPRSLQSSGKIHSILDNFSTYDLLKRFSFLPNSEALFSLVPTLMKKHNLLPNDAIILATCKIHNITKLASHDADFIVPCRDEGIELLKEE